MSTPNDDESVFGLDGDLIGTCAFMAAFLAGRVAGCLWEGDRDRGFLVFGQNLNEPRVWDPLRHSFLYVDPHDHGWRLYDFASAHHFQVQRDGETLTFADEITPTWSVHVQVGKRSVRASGLGGERQFRLSST